jgi:hypothetical protein
MLGYIFVAIAAYLLGSVPTGFSRAKARRVDIRTVGTATLAQRMSFGFWANPRESSSSWRMG